MKIYIAARLNKKEEVQKLYKKFQHKGYKVANDWTAHKSIKPYDQNQKMAEQYAIEDIDGAKNCDLFIILSDEEGTGMYTELGSAIASNLDKGKPKIYVVGDHISRLLFYFHPSVNRKKTIEEVLEEI